MDTVKRKNACVGARELGVLNAKYFHDVEYI